MNIPSRSDWGEVDEADLDAACALKHFLGKTFEEAEAMFARNALYYQEDLESMPPVAFNFYAPALARYLTSPRAEGDSDGASSYLRMLISVLKTRRELVMPETEKILLRAAVFVASNQAFYQADPNIYGRFADLIAELGDLGP
jgi:hypothetical protein